MGPPLQVHLSFCLFHRGLSTQPFRLSLVQIEHKYFIGAFFEESGRAIKPVLRTYVPIAAEVMPVYPYNSLLVVGHVDKGIREFGEFEGAMEKEAGPKRTADR